MNNFSCILHMRRKIIIRHLSVPVHSRLLQSESQLSERGSCTGEDTTYSSSIGTSSENCDLEHLRTTTIWRRGRVDALKLIRTTGELEDVL